MAKSVRDAMTEDARSIAASASVVEAARLMREEDIGSLPTTDDEKLVGMLTDEGPRRGAPTHGPPPSSAAARCRKRKARRHHCPGRHRPQREREEDG